jgi:hypothetical protein
LSFATRPYRRTANDRRKPLARYGARGSALRERLAPFLLRRQRGDDLRTRCQTALNGPGSPPKRDPPVGTVGKGSARLGGAGRVAQPGRARAREARL